MPAEVRNGPQISLRQMFVYAERKKGLWRVGWRVDNLSREILQLDAVRFPHSQFKADEQRFEPAIVLAYGEPVEFPTVIACKESAGGVVENGFAIFSSSWREEQWRIFVRLRINIDNEARPIAAAELITTQQAGFSDDPGSEN